MNAGRQILGAMLVLVCGCVGPAPRESFYTLSSEAVPAPAAASAPALAPLPDASISIGPLEMSEITDRPQLVIRIGPNRVEILEQQRWAQPLKQEIARVLAENLRHMLNTARVTVYPDASHVDYKVTLEVQKFESIPGTSATIAASWTVRRLTDGTSLGGSSLLTETTAPAASAAGAYDALVAAHSRALARLSQDIAQAIATAYALPLKR